MHVGDDRWRGGFNRYGVAGLALAVSLACAAGAATMTKPLRPCDRPAPLVGKPDPANPGYIVMFNDGVDARRETRRLAARYGFRARHVYEHALSGFSAEIPESALDGLRCEPSVRSIRHDTGVEADAEPEGGA